MLVLSRHREEVIRIGDDVKIKIVDIRGDKVRIGIEAPRETRVDREEVYQRRLQTGQVKVVGAE